jgi:nucleolar MIF4G domain-containing protein 1
MYVPSVLSQRAAVRLMLDLIQEKLYNPYYTLVGQELCRTSHAYKITLQFCLWDFLRELGETRVGGMGIINGLKGNDSGFDADKVSTTKLKNVAKAYGWWIAKDCVHLGILKVRTALREQCILYRRSRQDDSL